MTLQGVENVTARHQRGIFATKGHIVVAVGRKSFRIRNEVSSKVYAQMLDTSSTYPVRFAQLGERAYWLFNGRWFWDNEDLSGDQVYALLVTRDQRRHASINRAQSTVAFGQLPRSAAGLEGRSLRKSTTWSGLGIRRDADVPALMSNCSSTA